MVGIHSLFALLQYQNPLRVQLLRVNPHLTTFWNPPRCNVDIYRIHHPRHPRRHRCA